MKPLELLNFIADVCKAFNFPQDIRELFVFLKNNIQVANSLNNCVSEFQNSQNDLLYDLILIAYLRESKAFFPSYKYVVNNIIFNSSLPRLCLNLHANFSPLTHILSKENIPFVVVSDTPSAVIQSAFNSGLRTGHISTISAGKECLLKAKQYLNKNYVVNCDIDFKPDITSNYSLLSDSMLKLAIRIRVPTVFGINSVNDIGELVYLTINININNDLTIIKSEILNFISYYRKNSFFKFDKFSKI